MSLTAVAGGEGDCESDRVHTLLRNGHFVNRQTMEDCGDTGEMLEYITGEDCCME